MRRFAAAALVLVGVLPIDASRHVGEQQTSSVSQSELPRVRSQIAASVPEDQRAALLQRLDRAEAALKAARTYQALYLLEAPYEGAAAFAFAASASAQLAERFRQEMDGARRAEAAQRQEPDVCRRPSMRWRKRPRIAGPRRIRRAVRTRRIRESRPDCTTSANRTRR